MSVSASASSAGNNNGGRKTLTIKPIGLKRPRPALSNSFEEAAWAKLATAISAVHAKQPVPNNLSLEELYQAVEELVLHKLTASVYAKLCAQCDAHVSRVLASLAPPECAAAGGCVPTTVDRVALLGRVLEAWNDHCDGMHVIRSVFLTLDAQQLATGKSAPAISAAAAAAAAANGGSGAPSTALPRGGLWDMGIALFGKSLVGTCSLHTACVDGILEIVRRDRAASRGSDMAVAVDDERANLLRGAVTMLSALGLYSSVLEPRLLAETEAFYAAEGRDLVNDCISAGSGEPGATAVGECLRHAEQRLGDESRRASAMRLEAGTCRALVRHTEMNLIGRHVSSLLSAGFDAMCDSRRLDDLARLHRLLALIPSNNGSGSTSNKGDSASAVEWPLRDALSAYTKSRATAMVLDESRQDSMVQSLIDLKERLDEAISESFSGDSVLAAAVKDSLESAVNSRPTSNKPAELVARYLDAALRGQSVVSAKPAGASPGKAAAASDASPPPSKQKLTEDELERLIDRALVLFRCLQGKDVFEAFYKRDLAKRLLLQRSVSVDAEKNVITKLRHECGSQFTSKLEGMFKDIDLSRDVVFGFRSSQQGAELQSEGNRIEASVCVLTTGYWPTMMYDGAGGGQRGAAAAGQSKGDVILPQEVLRFQELFQDFYLKKHTGRRLRWQNAMGTCTLKATFPKCGTKELVVSVYQAVVLMLFNDSVTLSYEQIEERTNIPKQELARTLQSLACGKVRVLGKTPRGRDVEAGDMFAFNEEFNEKLFRIRINQIQSKETPEENKETNEKVMLDRQYQIDAAVVRIMKTRRTLSHSLLLNELFTQLKFPLKSSDLKKRIESLIDREYIERDSRSQDCYVYMA